jgi:hypothetical protein
MIRYGMVWYGMVWYGKKEGYIARYRWGSGRVFTAGRLRPIGDRTG